MLEIIAIAMSMSIIVTTLITSNIYGRKKCQKNFYHVTQIYGKIKAEIFYKMDYIQNPLLQMHLE